MYQYFQGLINAVFASINGIKSLFSSLCFGLIGLEAGGNLAPENKLISHSDISNHLALSGNIRDPRDPRSNDLPSLRKQCLEIPSAPITANNIVQD
ncbi:hypothetical protein PoB_006897600 [Plakobranchus ocellatus]|uniref:Uncharacterized protein n=1 Tax=Plakobranchus ocellatus TaxID=259542 RepID=A0AAV4DEB6_9GAST|nr:hypothetical protein PoB_006897600 [Plakobranchus ocellatus]